MNETDEFAPATPWPQPHQQECIFYHSMSYPDGDSVEGVWDVRGLFEQYIGHYPIAGKTLLDVGSAGGFLAFEAEKAGATVTAHDALDVSDFERVPFGDSLYHRDRKAFVEQNQHWYRMLRNAFWYSWHRNNSQVEMVYAPLERFPYWRRKFDVVFAGAILEHLTDPVSALDNMAGLANEAVIVAFTPVISSERQYMETANDWSNPQHDFTFWTLSRGLYKRVFNNLGFDVEFRSAKARFGGGEHTRETIVAMRRK